jgi:hypothetical protein
MKKLKKIKKFPQFISKRIYRYWSAPRDLEPRKKENGNAKKREFVIA